MNAALQLERKLMLEMINGLRADVCKLIPRANRGRAAQARAVGADLRPMS